MVRSSLYIHQLDLYIHHKLKWSALSVYIHQLFVLRAFVCRYFCKCNNGEQLAPCGVRRIPFLPNLNITKINYLAIARVSWGFVTRTYHVQISTCTVSGQVIVVRHSCLTKLWSIYLICFCFLRYFLFYTYLLLIYYKEATPP